MVLTQAADAGGEVRGGARPLDPSRDLGAIANLVGEAFSEELDRRGRAALRDMRRMARMSPLVWWWAQADPEFREGFNGFVWEEPVPGRRQGVIVGNVSLNRAPGDRRRWIVCNVVVKPEYRRRGIARRLTEEAIAEARRLGAEAVLLQVYRDNPAARQLYLDLGFREVTGETDWRLAEAKEVPLQNAPGYRFHPWRPADGQAAYDLACRALSPVQQWLAPVRRESYPMGFWDRLGGALADWLAGRQVERLVAWAEDRPAALLTVTLEARATAHHLGILVHPDHGGSVEAALLSRAMVLLAAAPCKPVWISVRSDHAAAADALRSFGFEERRTLLTLVKDL